MSAPRNALGRGLGALISKPPEASNEAATKPGDVESIAATVPQIRVALIDPNPDQPRRQFDPARLDSLAKSIARNGVLQPVVVTRVGERYQLVVGERRWRASQAAGLETIPAVVSEVGADDLLEVAIVENVQRHDLNPIELAHAYRALADRGVTQEDIGRRVSKDRSSVANHLRLLDLSLELQADVESGRITMGHAKALLQLGDAERRSQLRDRVVRDQLSVRETERLGRELAGPTASPRASKPAVEADAPAAPAPHLEQLAELLERHFQTRVRVSGSGERGRVEIEYTSSEDLDRVTRLILEGD